MSLVQSEAAISTSLIRSVKASALRSRRSFKAFCLASLARDNMTSDKRLAGINCFSHRSPTVSTLHIEFLFFQQFVVSASTFSAESLTMRNSSFDSQSLIWFAISVFFFPRGRHGFVRIGRVVLGILVHLGESAVNRRISDFRPTAVRTGPLAGGDSALTRILYSFWAQRTPRLPVGGVDAPIPGCISRGHRRHPSPGRGRCCRHALRLIHSTAAGLALCRQFCFLQSLTGQRTIPGDRFHHLQRA